MSTWSGGPASLWRPSIIVEVIVDVSWSIPRKELTEGYPHLQEINFPQLEGKKVDLLIGSGLYEAYIASDLKLGEPGQPYGIHNALGWTIYEKDATLQRPARVMVNSIRQEHPLDVSCQQVLKALTSDFEDIGAPQERCMSVEDKRALDITAICHWDCFRKMQGGSRGQPLNGIATLGRIKAKFYG